MPNIYIDKGKIIRGKPIILNDLITIYQPTIDEILDFGEQRVMSTFHTMCSAPWDMPSILDDMGVYFMDITPWEMFVMMRSIYTKEATSLFLGDLDISSFQPIVRENKVEDDSNEVSHEIILYNENEQIIDEETYNILISYIAEIFNFQHKNKRPGNKTTANIILQDDRKERKRAEEKDKPYESFIYDTVISLVNTEELSYTYETIFDLTLYQFTKSLIQIQGKKSAVALLQGSMSGFCDTSGIPKEDLQWMYSDDKYKPKGKKLVNQKIKK